MSHDSAAFEQQLNALLDGRLSGEEAREVREHLEVCDECRASYESLAAAQALLREMPAPAVPDGLLARIESEAAAEMARQAVPSIWQRWRAPVAAVAAAAAVLLAVFTPWQALHQDAPAPAVCPLPGDAAVVAEGPTDAPADETPAETPGDPAEGLDGGELADASAAPADDGMISRDDASGTARPRRHVTDHTVHTASAGAAVPAAEESVREGATEPSVAGAPAPPELAWASPSDRPSTSATEPVLSDAEGATRIALGPRTTIEPEPVLDTSGPSELETEMATGVVAGMVLDQFVVEHMVESSSTLLSVVTDTPTSELGPLIADDESEPGSFGFSFTDAMRRALTESENQVP